MATARLSAVRAVLLALAAGCLIATVVLSSLVSCADTHVTFVSPESAGCISAYVDATCFEEVVASPELCSAPPIAYLCFIGCVLALTATLSLSMSTLRAELVVWDPVVDASAVDGKGGLRGDCEGGGDVHVRGKRSRRLSAMVPEQDNTETEQNGEGGGGHSFRGAGGSEFQAAYAKLGQMRQVRICSTR